MEETNENKKMLIGVDEKPPIAKWIVLAFQHVFAMFGATILVPILVNTKAQAEVLSIPVTLVASGIGTLIYILCTQGKSPVYLGSSFAFIAPIVAAYLKRRSFWCNDRYNGSRFNLHYCINFSNIFREKVD